MNRNTDEEPIMQTVAEPLQQVLQQAAALAAKSPPKKANRTLPFRPTNRQPLATLTILNDGSREEGEQVYLRNSKIVIGREKGEITIPFDSDISSQHAELICQKQKGKYRWYLRDLGSTNGTFVRGYRASLSKETELMLGSRRYLFQLPDHHLEGDETQGLQTQAFRSPSPTMMEQFVPRLTESGTVQDGLTFSLGATEMLFGRSPDCQLAIENDPFLSPNHARFYQDERGRWMIDDKKSANGVWIRIKRMALDQEAEFQLGQQRFRFNPNVS
jgi:pSer/pThr/pTyr-binding forkhead associated (FHA) protein